MVTQASVKVTRHFLVARIQECMCSIQGRARLRGSTWTVSGVPKSSEAEVTSALLRLPLLPERLLDRILRSGSTDVASLQARRCRAAL